MENNNRTTFTLSRRIGSTNYRVNVRCSDAATEITVLEKAVAEAGIRIRETLLRDIKAMFSISPVNLQQLLNTMSTRAKAKRSRCN